MQLAQPRHQAIPLWRIEEAAGPRVLLGHPRHRFGIVGGFQAAKRIGDGDAVQDVDQIGADHRWVAE